MDDNERYFYEDNHNPEDTNGVDFEMQELLFQSEQRERLIAKNVGYTENPYPTRIEQLKRKREIEANLENESDNDRFKRSQEWCKFQQQRQIDKNNLKG
jgi:hypothetical protein